MEDNAAGTSLEEPAITGVTQDTNNTPAAIDPNQSLPIVVTTPTKIGDFSIARSSKSPIRLLPSKPPGESPMTPKGKRFRALYDELKTRYTIQQQSIVQLKSEREELKGKASRFAALNDRWKEKYDEMIEKSEESLLSENCALKEQLRTLQEELATTKENYETIIASRDEALEKRNAEIKEIKEKKQDGGVENRTGLRRIASEEAIFRLKPTKKKKQLTEEDKLACEFEGCGQTDSDLIRCNLCNKWVCGECNDIPVAKFKPVFNKCRTIYFICKTCDEKIGDQEGPPKDGDVIRASPGVRNSDLLTSLQKMLDQKVTQLESKIEKTIEKNLGEKLEVVNALAENVKEQSSEEKKSYAKILDVPKEVQKIMQETKNEEKVNLTEKEKRSQNFIIHGAKEVGDNDEVKAVNDEKYLDDILKHLGVESKPKTILRLGRVNEGKPRVLKVSMPAKSDKDEIMSRLNQLKGTEENFGKISVTDDYTATERKEIQEYAKKAREQSQQDPSRVFKVRGDPKNGLKIVSFKKN